MLTLFESILDVFFRTLMIALGLALASLMFAQIIMRYVLQTPFTGIEEVTVLLGVWIYFIGMGYCSKANEHIQGGIVGLIISDPYTLSLIRFLGLLISTVAAAIFGYFACKYALFVIEKGRLSVNLQWPRGFWSGSMIVGFTMMTGYSILEAIKEFRILLIQRKTRK